MSDGEQQKHPAAAPGWGEGKQLGWGDPPGTFQHSAAVNWGARWGDPLDSIKSERQAELRALADRQREWAEQEKSDPKTSPFAQASPQGAGTWAEPRLTGAEIFFLAAYALSGPNGDLEDAASRLRDLPSGISADRFALPSLHLEGAALDRAFLDGAILNEAHLNGSTLEAVHLRGAALGRAFLDGAILNHADLNDASLLHARLEGASLNGANLNRANLVGAHLERASLQSAQLQGARLNTARLEEADLRRARLGRADLTQANLAGAHLERANLSGLVLGRALLTGAHLERANLCGANLEGADLSHAHLEGVVFGSALQEESNQSWLEWRGTQFARSAANWGPAPPPPPTPGPYPSGIPSHTYFGDPANYSAGIEPPSAEVDFDSEEMASTMIGAAYLGGARLFQANLEGADLTGAHLQGSNLTQAHLEGAILFRAYLERADLSGAHLNGANLFRAHLEGANLSEAHLEGKVIGADEMARIRSWIEDFPEHLAPADLRLVFLDEATTLNGISLGDAQYGYVRVAGVRWNRADLSILRWPEKFKRQTVLGDERIARKPKDAQGKPKTSERRLEDYQAAVRANRQLAVTLQDQGMSEDAARFAYRAQLLQQQVLWRQSKFGAYLFSRFLDGLAGYGYKPVRSLIAYVVLVLGFAAAYYALGVAAGPQLPWYEALVVSLTAFHGRGFFAQQFSPGDPQSILAAGEAVVGLLIEISFIATFTQRFLAR